MRKLVVIFAISSLFASFAMAFYDDEVVVQSRGIGCDPSTKSCIYAGAFKPSSKCGSSSSLSDTLCRLGENIRVKSK